MQKSFMFGHIEKHRLDFRGQWMSGFVTLSCDGKTISRHPFFSKFEQSFELGDKEKHLVTVNYNFFDYFGDVVKISIDGQRPTADMEIHDKQVLPDTPMDDAAAALLFVAFVNIMFSVIGTLFIPDLDALKIRLMLLLGGMIYALLAVRTLFYQKWALMAATVLFMVDSVFELIYEFSFSGLLMRVVIFYYLFAGIRGFKQGPSIAGPRPV